MHSLLLLSSLALLTPVLAAPDVQYSFPASTSTPTATAAPNAVALPTPLFTMPSKATIQELKRRGAIVPGMPLNRRQVTCTSGTYTCSDGSGCCKLGSLCFGSGYCYDPSVNMDIQISSILAEYTGVDYLGIESMLNLLTNTYALGGSSTGGSYETGISTNTNTNTNTNDINVGGDDPAAALGSKSSRKKKSNTGMIAGIIVAVVVVIVAVIIAVWLFRRTKKNREIAAGAVQQPLMTQPHPQPPINTPMPPPGSYPPTPVPYNAPTPGPYPPTPGPYPPNPAPFDAYGAAADKDKVPYYSNQPGPPNTVEMPANQSVHGQQQHYQSPALPAAGIVEANGDSTYRSPSTGQNPNNNNYNYGQQPPNPHQMSEMGAGGHPPGHPPPNQTGPVFEMDSRQYRQN